MKKKQLLLFLSMLFVTACGNNSGNSQSNSNNGNKQGEEESSVKHKYLPQKVVVNVTGYTLYEYSSDLHTVISTEVTDFGKQVKTVTFNADYTKFTCVTEEYNRRGDDFALYGKEKFDYEVKPNNSYIKTEYDFDEETNDFVFNREKIRTYNERGQIILSASRVQNPNDDSSLIYDEYLKYEYDENGYQTKYEDCGYINNDYNNLFVKIYTSFEYNDDKTYLKTEDFIYDTETNKYNRDGYETNVISVSDNVITFDNQIYNEDGSEHNHNILKYDSNWVNIYADYGGMDEIDQITYNEFYQIVKSESTDERISISATATYMPNGGSMLSAQVVYDTKDSPYDSAVKHHDIAVGFTYNKNEQLTKVKSTHNIVSTENATNHSSTLTNDVEITYTKLECDQLYEFLPYYLDIVNVLTDYQFETMDTYF